MEECRADRIRVRRQFFELLQSGLWGRTANAILFVGMVEWEALLKLARAQALLGIAFDGLETLPPAYRPPKMLYLQWCAAVAQVEQANEKLDRCAAGVIEHYRQGGLSPLLLKGQGIARYYLRPEHRQCGDIDVYLGGGRECNKANAILGGQGGVPVGEEGDHHTSYNFRGMMVENHHSIGKLCAPWANRRFQKLINKEARRHLRMVDIGGTQVQLPSPMFNALYLFVHAFRHFVLGGVGLRQLCDWCRLLYIESDNINYNRLRHELRRLGLLQAALVFRDVVVTFLGLPSEKLPIAFTTVEYCIRDEAEELLDEIFATGNFGQFDARIAPRPAGYWRGKWYTFTSALQRCKRFYHLAPAEVLFQPLALIRGSAQTQWKKLMRKSSSTDSSPLGRETNIIL